MAGRKGMQTGGNNKKSIEEHMLEGTYRPHRHDKKKVAEGKRMRLEFDPFMAGETNLSEKQVFNTLAKYLYDMQMTQEVDKFLLQQWTTLYCAQRDVKQHMIAHGYDAKYGSKMAINLYQELSKDIRVLLSEYNLTPNTRIRASVKVQEEEPKEDDNRSVIEKFVVPAND